MTDQEEKTLERIVDVYNETQKHLPYEFVVKTRLEEIDHLYNLHFNTFTPQTLPGKIAKKVFQKLTGPLYRKQVGFNTAVRDLLKQTVATVDDLQREVKALSEQIENSDTA